MHTDAHRWDQITEAIIGCAYKIGNDLGCGFLERVYENAMVHELQKAGLFVEPQHPITVVYDGVVVGDYAADLLVEGTIIVELKAVKDLDEVHTAQCINYLKATKLPICLLINFGRTRVQIKRFVSPAYSAGPSDL